jgi:2-polyprenyl-3-methyl-5-hydroxy-6-metoxy-1,4-benzoquinol methylase
VIDPDTDTTTPVPAYALGHSDGELERLRAQARLIDPITHRFFRDAGIIPGMRVLDVGSGAGDVAFLAAEMVGETGEVIGVERAAAALDVANARADARSLRNVSFRLGDPVEMVFERPFDAIVGRYVLQFQGDPVTMLRKLAAHVRPGGSIVFHELDWGGARSLPSATIYDTCCRWIVETLRLLGTERNMGIKLHATFVAAGLPAPSMRLEAIIAGGVNSAVRLGLVADLVETLSADMERLGVATATEISIETLAERMRAEAIANGSVIVAHSEIGAWVRV